jgi:hypothetical protein
MVVKPQKPQPPDMATLARWIRQVVPQPGAPTGSLTHADLAIMGTTAYKVPIKRWRIGEAIQYDRHNHVPGTAVLIGAPWRLVDQPREPVLWATGELGILHTWMHGYRLVLEAVLHLPATARNPLLASRLKVLIKDVDRVLEDLQDAIDALNDAVEP